MRITPNVMRSELRQEWDGADRPEQVEILRQLAHDPSAHFELFRELLAEFIGPGTLDVEGWSETAVE